MAANTAITRAVSGQLSQARLLELNCNIFQVPYKISGGTSFFARNEIKDVMAYLRLLINPTMTTRFCASSTCRAAKLVHPTLEGLGTYATIAASACIAACEEIGLQSHLPEAALERLREFGRYGSADAAAHAGRRRHRCH